MTLSQLQAEWEYRRAERLGVLCEDREPTVEQIKIAEKEADEWLQRYNQKDDKTGQRSLNL